MNRAGRVLTHLLLMRHAKSSWTAGVESDHERPLNARGREEALAMAKALVERGLAPDTIWASSAVRTRETAHILMRAIPGAQTVVSVPAFYAAAPEAVLHELAGADEPEGRLMLLGHNPGWQSLTGFFTGAMREMPTAAICVLARRREDLSWHSSAAWELLEHLTPRSVGAR